MRHKVRFQGVSEAWGQPRGSQGFSLQSLYVLALPLWVTWKFLKRCIQDKSAFPCYDSAVDLRKSRALK